MRLAQGHNKMCTGRGSNQGPLGPKSDALTTVPLRHLIRIIGPCNLHPLTPHICIVKPGFIDVYIIFRIYALEHRLWVLVRTASVRRRFYCVPMIYVLSKNTKNVTMFHIKITLFKAIKNCSTVKIAESATFIKAPPA